MCKIVDHDLRMFLVHADAHLNVSLKYSPTGNQMCVCIAAFPGQEQPHWLTLLTAISQL